MMELRTNPPAWAARGLRAAALAAALSLASGIVPLTVAGAAPPTYGSPSASFIYGAAVRFTQPVLLASVPARVEILLDFPGALGLSVSEIAPSLGIGRDELTYQLDTAAGQVVPNTTIRATWRLTATDGAVSLGPTVSVTYADTRFDWRTRTGQIVRLHWYEGSEAFADRALSIGDGAVARAADLLGVTEDAPIDFFVYADQGSFYDALGPGTRDNVGGEAHADIRTLFALITPDEVNSSWVATVVPHELTHIVFDTAVRNPYHRPPRWLDEGVAVYLSEGNTPSYRSELIAAAGDGRVIPLNGLSAQFPTTGEQFSLAYAESVDAIDYIVHSQGQDALVRLIRSYARGVSDDEAFSAAIGMDASAFADAWLAWTGVPASTRYGPQPAPAGPVPPDWGGSPPTPSASGPPAAASPTAAGATEAGAGKGARTSDAAAILLTFLIVGGAIGVAVIVARRRSPMAGGA